MLLTESHKQNIFLLLIATIYILYIFTFLGIIYFNKYYIRMFSVIVQSFVCISLLMKFNPFTKNHLSDFDRTLIFSSTSFLLFNLLFTEIYAYFIEKIHLNTIITNIMNPTK
jgi:hypothetical protein